MPSRGHENRFVDPVGGRMLARSSVYVLLRNSAGDVLLIRRLNTGYLDGWYDLPAGHVEEGEPLTHAAIRELREETGLVARAEHMKLWHVNQLHANGELYYCFFFTLDRWDGVPQIGEPDKCDDLQFFAVDDLPKTTPTTHAALSSLSEVPVSCSYTNQSDWDKIVKAG